MPGNAQDLRDTRPARQVNLRKQLELQRQGDVARRLSLAESLRLGGGWTKRLSGPIDPMYTKHCFGHSYCGPACFPTYCWFPQWNDWVGWCFTSASLPERDPRPTCCRPSPGEPCPAWAGWDYPEWQPLPDAACGTWIDVPLVTVLSGVDVQLLAVRFVDPGHPQEQLGPRYRVWLRNNSPVALRQPVNLVAFASNDRRPEVGLPGAGQRIPGMDAGQVQSVDLRLPFDACVLGRDAEGRTAPFRFLHVIADSHRELPEATEHNNGIVLDRGEILPADPALFSVQAEAGSQGAVTVLAGEGFGPEAGQVLIHRGGQEWLAEILGWCDVGARIRLPDAARGGSDAPEFVVIRGDRAASNPLRVPHQALATAPDR